MDERRGACRRERLSFLRKRKLHVASRVLRVLPTVGVRRQIGEGPGLSMTGRRSKVHGARHAGLESRVEQQKYAVHGDMPHGADKREERRTIDASVAQF